MREGFKPMCSFDSPQRQSATLVMATIITSDVYACVCVEYIYMFVCVYIYMYMRMAAQRICVSPSSFYIRFFCSGCTIY